MLQPGSRTRNSNYLKIANFDLLHNNKGMKLLNNSKKRILYFTSKKAIEIKSQLANVVRLSSTPSHFPMNILKGTGSVPNLAKQCLPR